MLKQDSRKFLISRLTNTHGRSSVNEEEGLQKGAKGEPEYLLGEYVYSRRVERQPANATSTRAVAGESSEQAAQSLPFPWSSQL